MEAREQLTVSVTLMAEPCLWRWDIFDEVRGAVVASSWEDDWSAYESRDEALAAGCDRLSRLARERWGAARGHGALRRPVAGEAAWARERRAHVSVMDLRKEAAAR